MLALERAVGAGAPPPPLLNTGLPPPLKLLVHDSAKPGRRAAATAGAAQATNGAEAELEPEIDLWVAHSTAAYAAEHLLGTSLGFT